MKTKFLIPIALLALGVAQNPARADVNSCVQNLISTELSGGPFTYTGGEIIATAPYQGTNYHLISLDASGRKSQLVVQEGKNVCKKTLYNPLGHEIKFSSVMPKAVADTLEPAAIAYNKQRWKEEQVWQKELAEEYRRNGGRVTPLR